MFIDVDQCAFILLSPIPYTFRTYTFLFSITYYMLWTIYTVNCAITYNTWMVQLKPLNTSAYENSSRICKISISKTHLVSVLPFCFIRTTWGSLYLFILLLNLKSIVLLLIFFLQHNFLPLLLLLPPYGKDITFTFFPFWFSSSISLLFLSLFLSFLFKRILL